MTTDHNRYMKLCLELAVLGTGSVSPNPMVGSVIVHDDQILCQGYHQCYGQVHAEVNAINAAINNLNDDLDVAAKLFKQSTIYVSLEPCAHFGKTPPCADLIIKHQFPKVVIGCRDPFELANGKGIDVVIGILEDECLKINRRFFIYVQKKRPYIILKWAQTEDAYFAPPSDKNAQLWITGEESRKLVHQWRSEEDAILVGKDTARIDNPQLNVRYTSGRSPKRIVLDRKLELPKHLNIFDQSVSTFILNEMKNNSSDGNTRYLSLEEITSKSILSTLYQHGIQSVIIEGGAKVLELFIKEGLWDEARIFTGNVTWKSGIKAPQMQGHIIKTERIGNDTLNILRNNTDF